MTREGLGPKFLATLLPAFTLFSVVLLFCAPLQCVPITYTGFVITGGTIGGRSFQNARIVLRFESDTDYVQDTTIDGVHVAYNPNGNGHVSIAADNFAISADFQANQLFVSVDFDNGGIGFGSFAPDGSLYPTYPLGVYGDMINAALPIGMSFGPSPQLAALPLDLKHSVGIAGLGRTCSVGPVLPLNTVCPKPTVPLKTNRGDLFLYEPYNTVTTGNVLNAGFFFADLGSYRRTLPSDVFMPSAHRSTGRITYHALLYSDVSLGGTLFPGAKILLSFTSNTSYVQPVPGNDPYAYQNTRGTSRVTVFTRDGRTLHATFAPNQLYVYFTPASYTFGIGSVSAGSGYPLGIAVGGCLCFGEVMTGYALAEILNDPASASFYSPQTALLNADLQHEVTLSGNAYSCDPFDVGLGCSTPMSPPALTSDHGDFYLFEPFTRASPYGGPTGPVSVNATVFWATFGGTSEAESEDGDSSERGPVPPSR